MRVAAEPAERDALTRVLVELLQRVGVEVEVEPIERADLAAVLAPEAVASAYFDTLGKLRAQSPEACGGFVRQGEAEPLIVGYLQGSQHTAHLQALATAVFEAIADGRQVPRVHPQPSQAQYGMLAGELTKRGWTQADFKLLSSRQAMAQADAGKVCQLMHDFFAVQLELPDPEVQMRLIVDSLRPVFAG